MGIIAKDYTQPPPKNAPAGEIRAFLDKKSPYDHVLHIRQHSLYRKADLYYQGIQWIQPSYNLDPTRTPHWSQIEYKDDDIPRPVYNEMAPVIQNEAARLGRPEYKPYVRPAGENPDAATRQAAERSIEILLAELDRNQWEGVAELGYHHMPLYGGWRLKSYWNVSMEKTVRVPVSGAHRCPQCGCSFASPEIPEDKQALIDPARYEVAQPEGEIEAGADPKIKVNLHSCIKCNDHDEELTEDQPALDELGQPIKDEMGALMMAPVTRTERVPGPPKLEPFTPADDELHQADYFERPLGEDVPLGEWKIETCSPYDEFLANLGVDEDPVNWTEIMEVHIESCDWVRARARGKEEHIKPESMEALLRWHPVAGERAIFYSSTIGAGVFRNHVRVKEYHKKPFMERDPKTGKWGMNRGRSIMMAGDVVILDGDYLMESKNNPGTMIPRVHYDYAAWEPRSGGREAYGVSMSEQMFDVQDNINEAKSQTQDARQREASPKWLIPRGMNFDYEDAGEAGCHWQYDPLTDNPQVKPERTGSTTIAAGVAAEIESDISFLHRASGNSEVEQGSTPSGVSAAAAIQILSEQTAEKRRPRIRRIREMFERTWSHGLMLCHEFVREDRKFKTKKESGEWAERTWKGLDIAGQTDVKIDPEPESDSEIQKQERIRDGINLRVIDPTNPKVARLVAQDLKISSDLYGDQNRQYETAEREFIDYLDLNREPAVDDGLDDHPSHVDQHGADFLGEKWRDLEILGNWNEANLWLWGWEGAFEIYSMTAQQKWPEALELRILRMWYQRLAEPGMSGTGVFANYWQQKPRTGQEKAALAKILRMRSHYSAHKMLMEAQSMAPAPEAAPTDSPATADGMAPTGQGMAA